MGKAAARKLKRIARLKVIEEKKKALLARRRAQAKALEKARAKKARSLMLRTKRLERIARQKKAKAAKLKALVRVRFAEKCRRAGVTGTKKAQKSRPTKIPTRN